MCGIVGFIGQAREGQWQQTHDLLRGLFLAAEHRGQDATGFVAHTEPLDSPSNARIVLAKEPLPASRFVEENAAFRGLRHQRSSVVVGHVRAATHGKPERNENNHPFVSKDGQLFLVHNGIVGNHEELADKYGLKLETECDSEVILRLIEREETTAGGLQRCLQEVEGSLAVAVYDRATTLLWLARNGGRPLWLAKLKNDKRTFFASTGQIILDALKRIIGGSALPEVESLFPIAGDSPLALSASGVILAPFVGGS